MKKGAYVTVPIDIDGDNMGIRVEFDYFSALYLQSKLQDKECMEISVDYNDKTYTTQIQFSMAERLIRQVALLLVDLIPKSLRIFFRDLTQEAARRQIDPICDRENELEKVWFYLSQPSRNNVFLIGDTEVGKTAIAREVTRQIVYGECPKEFFDKRIIMLRPEELIRINSNSEDDDNNPRLKKTVEAIMKFVSKNRNKIILYVDKGILMKTDYLLMSLLNALIMKYKIPFITTTSAEDYDDYFINDFYLSKYINYVYVEEPELNKVQPMIQGHIDKLKMKYNIKISDKLVKFGIYTSVLTGSVSANPGNAINVFRKAFLEAKRKEKKSVDKECILSCYDSYLKLYESMPDNEKKATAYHETGHYIAHIMSEHLKNVKVAFVSILPMMTFLGVNWFYYDMEEESVPSREYFMDSIVVDLAGRAAEKLVVNKKTAGAVSDLEHANTRAKTILMKYGLSEEGGNTNRFYDFEDYFLMSEKKKELLDKEIQNIINEAYMRAEALVNENKELIKTIAEKLLKDEILTGEQLKLVCKEHKAKKSKTQKKTPQTKTEPKTDSKKQTKKK